MLGPQAPSISATVVVARIFLIVPDFPDSLGAAANFGEKLIVDLASSFFRRLQRAGEVLTLASFTFAQRDRKSGAEQVFPQISGVYIG